MLPKRASNRIWSPISDRPVASHAGAGLVGVFARGYVWWRTDVDGAYTMARWNLSIPDTTDRAVRTYLASTGRQDDDLSRIVDEAVRRHLFDQTVREVKGRNADLDQEMLRDLVDQETDAVRAGRSR